MRLIRTLTFIAIGVAIGYLLVDDISIAIERTLFFVETTF